MISRDEFQDLLNGVDLTRRHGASLIATKVIVVHLNSFLLPYRYEIQCNSLDEVPQTLAEVYTHGFYA